MITGIGFTHETFKFPVGELHVRVKAHQDIASINFSFERSEEVLELLLLCDALKREGVFLKKLYIPYVPFGRQDRVAVGGECFSLSVLCNLINSIGFQLVQVTDPHSDVQTALLDNCEVIEQWEVFKDVSMSGYLVCPDGGALKKIYKLAKVKHLPVVECSKKRDVETGEITGVIVHAEDLDGKDCYIVDDICDGGRTFTEIAKVLRSKNCGKIALCVTHGFFTKGLEVFDGLIDEIYTLKGKVK